MGNEVAEVAAEQAYLDRAYARLEYLQVLAGGLASDELAERMPQPAHRVEREARQATGTRRLAELRLGSLGLCFGRIDRIDGETFHIGRIAVDDEDREPLVVDWRAPVAEPFYRATPGQPLGLIRRRYLLTRGRRVVGIDDEVLDLAGESDRDDVVLIGEAALLEALGRARTGRMADIVATIQAEQDEIIRAPLGGVVVVQGGPGTGKTAVALHRAAYLLYTHRFPLERQGILIVGPNPVFLRYIERVLPSLGETGCRMATIAELVRGVTVIGSDSADAARVKGDSRMAEVIARAIAGRQRALRRSVDVPFGSHVLRLSVAASASAVERAQQAPGTHNARRAVVERLVLNHLYSRYMSANDRARRTGIPTRDALPRDEVIESLRTDRTIRTALDRIWPVLTPMELLRDLFGSRALLDLANDGSFSSDDVDALERARTPVSGVAWTAADVPLLDEAAVWLGVVARPKRRPAGADPEQISLMVDRVLADKLPLCPVCDQELGYVGTKGSEFQCNTRGCGRTVPAKLVMSPAAEVELRDLVRSMTRAVKGPSEESAATVETFGHLVVDEAQDVSPMAWRMLSRRCPAGSMTIVGDLGQGSTDLAPADWSEVIANIETPRSRVVHLTVNYRTPAEIMVLADAVLAADRPDLEPARSVRSTGEHPILLPASRASLADVVAAHVRDRSSTGTIGVIAPRDLVDDVRHALDVEARVVDLEAMVTVLNLPEAKGLEFDSVVVVEPAQLVAESPHGLRALYVALTRPTTNLSVIYADALPAPLADVTSGVVR